MAHPRDVLGMNARQKLYVALNSKRAKRYAYSKLAPKSILTEHGISVPQVFAIFSSIDEAYDFAWETIKSPFVIKPVGGNAGKGILIIKKPAKYAGEWIGIDGKLLNTRDLRVHVINILEGQYSTYGTQHRAFVEERITVHPKFRRYVYRGTPDVRIIVYNRVPVMAMLRLPTKESEGRANLHQGAIGVGVDIASGVTLRGIWHNKPIRYFPGSKRKLNGIRLPKWNSLLLSAVKVAEVTGLAYAGVDLFMHIDKGPMVVELNSNPGLSIQLANNAGLRRRLERVEGLKIRDVEHGARVGRALFAEQFADKVISEDGLVVVNTFEKVKIRTAKKKWIEVEAKADTGAFRSALDRELASELGLLDKNNILWEGKFYSSYGRQRRPVIGLFMKVKGRKLRTTASIVDRKKMRAKLLLGRRDLQGFLIKPQLHKE